MKNNALLVLEDGFALDGSSFGADGETFGEVVFNTGLTGYQEVLTDPSYKGQIVVMTYPHIGNYGINFEDFESDRIHLSGFVVKEYSKTYSNYRAKKSLQEYLLENKVVAIDSIDTRALVRHIRSFGAMRCGISTSSKSVKTLLAKIKKQPSIVVRDLVREVTTKRVYKWKNNSKKSIKIAVIDCGVKYSILRKLSEFNCEVIVMPASIGYADVLKIDPDGILISNGPGDPSSLSYLINTIRKLIGKKPILGICLGHQLLSLALGFDTYKLKFGHRGNNQPVLDTITNKVEITTQNHGFAVDFRKLVNKDIVMTYVNLNDNTCEGIACENLNLFSVQFHPEASPGPSDSNHLFEKFVGLICQEEKILEKF